MQNTFFLRKSVKTSQDEKLLLRLSFAEMVTQEDISVLLAGYDIESARLEFSLLLAYLLKRNLHLEFPKQITPRLEGIIRYFQHRNATLLCAFNEIGKQLNEKKIPILLMKGIAMRYFRPNEPRCMWDVDFMVPEEYYDEAIQTAIDLGYEKKEIVYQYHSTDLSRGVAAIDIHRLFTKGEGNYWEVIREMFSNAKETIAFDVNVLVPRPEDLLLITLVNSYYNIVIQPTTENTKEFYWFYDCARIIRDNKNLDWDIVCNTASRIGILYQIFAMLDLLDGLIPAILPAELQAKVFRNRKKTAYSVNMDVLTREKGNLFYERKYNTYRTLPGIVSYTVKSVKYIWMWGIQKNPFMRFLFLNVYIKHEIK
jgi:hypothetical protein